MQSPACHRDRTTLPQNRVACQKAIDKWPRKASSLGRVARPKPYLDPKPKTEETKTEKASDVKYSTDLEATRGFRTCGYRDIGLRDLVFRDVGTFFSGRA